MSRSSIVYVFRLFTFCTANQMCMHLLFVCLSGPKWRSLKLSLFEKMSHECEAYSIIRWLLRKIVLLALVTSFMPFYQHILSHLIRSINFFEVWWMVWQSSLRNAGQLNLIFTHQSTHIKRNDDDALDIIAFKQLANEIHNQPRHLEIEMSLHTQIHPHKWYFW